MTKWVRRISDNGGRDLGGNHRGDDERFGAGSSFTPQTTFNPSNPSPTNQPSITSPSVAGLASARACFDRYQNTIAAQFQPKINPAVGICQSATVSRDMWQAVVNAAIQCKMPAAAIGELRRAVASSQNTANNSCIN